jgi:hypothetical protein
VDNQQVLQGVMNTPNPGSMIGQGINAVTDPAYPVDAALRQWAAGAPAFQPTLGGMLTGTKDKVLGATGGFLQKLMAKDYEGAMNDSLFPMGAMALAKRTPEFDSWFGDSKIVDEAGEPLQVYHGTVENFAEFDKGKVKSRFPYSFGFHLTSRAPEAARYAEEAGGNVMPVYVKAKNPLVIDTKQPSASMEADLNRAEIIKKLYDAKVAGKPYDAVVINRIVGDEYDGKNIIVFDPSQIKSATGNSGQFSPSDPRIDR